MTKLLAAAAAVVLLASPAAASASTPPKADVKAITITPAAPRAGEPVTIGFTLRAPAPAGGTSVWVRYDDPWWQDPFSLPDTYFTVPAGETSGSVSMPVEILPRSYQASKFTVLAGNNSKAFTIQARPNDGEYRLLSWTAAAAIVFGEQWGTTVTLNQLTPPEGLVLGRINRIIPPGRQVHTFANTAPTLEQALASAYGSPSYAWLDQVYLGDKRVGVTPFSIAEFHGAILYEDRMSIVGGWGSGTPENPYYKGFGLGARAGAGGVVVSLSVSDPRFHVPATITVPAGAPGTTFPITKDPGTSSSVSAYVTATWAGGSITERI